MVASLVIDPQKHFDLVRLHREAAAQWEIIARRASEGARSASKGAERLQRRVCRLQDEVTILKGKVERLVHENGEQQKKISRLSLELLAALSKRVADAET